MAISKKTLKTIFDDGSFTDAERVRLALQNLTEAELRLALEQAQLSEAEKRSLLRRNLTKSESIPFNVETLGLAKRWLPYFKPNVQTKLLKPFRFSHSQLVHKAMRKRPSVIGSRVTDFSSWVFSLYREKHSNAAELKGKEDERSVVEHIKLHYRPREYSGWKLIYQDAGIDDKAVPLKISALTANGKPLVGRPDFVFRNEVTNEILIVEIKCSLAEIPENGWPNLKAQLWAYAHIDDWFGSAPNIHLVAEIWGNFYGRLVRQYVHRWDYGETDFNAENAELFDLYRGVHPGLR